MDGIPGNILVSDTGDWHLADYDSCSRQGATVLAASLRSESLLVSSHAASPATHSPHGFPFSNSAELPARHDEAAGAAVSTFSVTRAQLSNLNESASTYLQ